MESESSFVARQLTYFFATLYAQIKLSTRNGLSDLAKNQEVSLLNLINKAYGKEFKDLNVNKSNFPAIDYGDQLAKLGLQMTATVSKQKFKDTIDKLNNDPALKIQYPTIIFFLLTVEPVNASIRYVPVDTDVNYVTLFDMLKQVTHKDLEFQKDFFRLLKIEYGNYFIRDMNKGVDFNLIDDAPTPQDLMLFNEFICTQEWFPDNTGEAYIEIYKFIDSFRLCLKKCPLKARNILLSCIKVAGIPSFQSEKIQVYADEVIGSLNLEEKDYSTFEYYLEFLIQNNLLEKENHFQDTYTIGDDLYIKNRLKFVLNYRKWEPEMNLYSALIGFYIKHHDFSKFEHALINNDFSLLSDSKC
ncbi:SMEK domain-containing protein [Aeromonas bestiarum]|uniref:SMEK domain-containing protein n=1 Tax=Aeromonas bestiarum TaxID=105751 RepID=UPI002378DBD1|nr:SMEK domain-containing protein [Aeromonas bestiarum]WDL82563.1 SMEK domain-containing protein [Aeromonas bestiarum]